MPITRREASRQIAKDHTQGALQALAELPGEKAFLAALIESLLSRAA